MKEKIENRLKKAVDRSGFPLQLKLETITQKLYNWKVEGRELYWEIENNSGFIDTVYSLRQPSKKVISEVKKTSGGEWIFLSEMKSDKNTHITINLYSSVSENTREYINEWNGSEVDHYTCWSAFCIMSGQNENNPMLERLCTHLLMATEAFANKHIKSEEVVNNYGFPISYVPVIITNTPMYLCSYESSNIDLETGMFTEEPEFEKITSVAFQKPFWSSVKNGDGIRYSSKYLLNEAQDRTVFIVHTTAFSKFLADLDPSTI